MRKLIVLLLVMLTVMGTLFAQGKTETAAVEEARPEVVNLKVWYSISGSAGTFFESQVAAFQEAHPEIAIELTYSGSYADSATKISAAKMAGDAPDMVITSASQLYPGQDGDFSMEELATTDAEFDVADIQSGILEYAKYEGKIASLPFGISTQVIYYNKELVAAAGLDLEKNPPKTWNEFVEVVKTVMAATGVAGFDTSDSVWLVKSMLYQNDNQVVEVVDGTITPTFDNESGLEVADYWKSLVDSGVMEAGAHSNAEKKFLAGNLAFVAATSNRITRWEGSTSFTLGAIEMPCFKKQAVALGGSTTTILTTDKWTKDAAWQLIKYVLNTENQSAFALASGYLPIRKSSLEVAEVKDKIENNELYNVATKQLSYAWAYTHFGAMGTMDSLLWYALDDIEHGTKTPADAFKNAASQLIQDID